MKTLASLFILLIIILPASAGGYKVGDVAADFKLKNVDGKMVSLADFKDAKGFVVIFTCNHCPFAKAYQARIQEIDTKYKPKGYPVIAINPNDPTVVPEDSYDAMITLAKEKSITYPYLIDEKQDIYKMYGATRTPHVFLLKRENNKLIVEYIGTIDDNYQDASAVNEKYLANALDAVLAGKKPQPDFTKAIGCSIKDNSVAK